MSTKKRLQRGRMWLVMLLLAGSMTGYAQSNYFTYKEGSNETIIDGLTSAGQAATSLTIPATVKTVNSGAFTQATSLLTELHVDNGGNPTFESGLFGENANTLTFIDMGDGMSISNMIALLQSLGTSR